MSWRLVALSRGFSLAGTRSYYSSQKLTNCHLGIIWRGQCSLFIQNVRRAGLPYFTSRSSTSLGKPLYATAADEDVPEEQTKTIQSRWNAQGLRKEVQRLVLRCHKKVGKANQRFMKAKARVDQLLLDERADLDDLEDCPDVDALELELKELKDRLKGLNSLEESLTKINAKEVVLPTDVAALAIELGVNDEPPKRQPRGPGKKKGPHQTGPRLPYRRYYAKDKTEIRVGKKAEDNDELSLSPKHRSGSDWWMHASGCPGSHVVIRSDAANLPEEVVLDAAALAARQSKCGGSVIKVSLTRCRDVSKPAGAKPGLVMLSGKVKTVSVDMKEAESRLKRLDSTVVFN